MNANTFVERSIVRNLINTLAEAEIKFARLFDGEEYVLTEDPVAYLFENLDDARFHFTDSNLDEHWVSLIRGNGDCIISDYSLTAVDPTNKIVESKRWNVVMDRLTENPFPQIV